MRFKGLIAGVVLLLFMGCSSTMKYTWTKDGFSGKHYEKILIVALTDNQESRTTFENTMVKDLEEQGIVAENSMTLLPPFKNAKRPSESEIHELIVNNGFDAVIVSSLLDVESQEVFEYNDNMYNPVYYRHGRYIYSHYNYMSNSGYYKEEKSYVIESRLFDVSAKSKEDAVVWSGQSTLTDPTSYYSASRQYAKRLAKTLIENKIIN
ncbi:MAG: hypothetical protein BM564_08890 [Bacteroidetes bacterium MedPE-SWsnd-G2]|nr:MAG: hypothetical protein BM564_08890 [Bacteroidetes bacterium MedPE-SWsnd-G2]